VLTTSVSAIQWVTVPIDIGSYDFFTNVWTDPTGNIVLPVPNNYVSWGVTSRLDGFEYTTDEVSFYGNYDYQTPVYVIIQTDDGNGTSADIITYICDDGDSSTVKVGEFSSWQNNGTVLGYITVSNSALSYLRINSLTDERSTVQWSKTCEFVGPEAMTVTILTQPDYENNMAFLFILPDTALSELVERIQGVLIAGYDVVEIGFMVMSTILFFFILVFMWKVFEYFVNRIRYGGVRR